MANAKGTDWLTPAELAEQLRVPVRTLEQWRYRRIGPPYAKVGHSVRYRRVAVDRWLAEHEVRAG